MSTDTVTISREEYESLLKANAELAQQVKDLSEAIALLRKQRFGSSSEKNKVDDGSEQLSFLFNEAEVYADTAGSIAKQEPDLTTVKEHTRTKRAVNSVNLPDDVEIERGVDTVVIPLDETLTREDGCLTGGEHHLGAVGEQL